MEQRPNEEHSSFGNSPVFNIGSNSFVMSGVQAYSKHHHWVIKPDDVWIAICSQFSNYVNERSEKLRSKFVDFDGKKELVVKGIGTLYTANYEDLSIRMTSEIAKNIKDPSVREWVMPDFTTTTQSDRMVGAVVLMAAMKKYFDYKFELECNLPSVTLLGQVEDWIKIRERANRLLEFDTEEECMKKWSQYLFPVLDKFVESIKGNPDKEWWNRVANFLGGGSGPSFISGWITTFCVFSETGKWLGDQKTEGEVWYEDEDDNEPKEKVREREWPVIDDEEIPRGYVSVPITVDDNGTVYKTEMFAGHIVASVLNQNSIQPRVDWALFLKKEDYDKEYQCANDEDDEDNMDESMD
ncbi:predicted protein [Naegleria gruberi]|uniref:Predicted protein n=1 Tax=Naegleria gruberi TaxID=5762 RepID=D2W2R6_NAEGR|nr:uncharacterized protein NAEGRDRAFT_83346 [Naegleria gruberi]EFC36665.1 predicted protein [Naegleria gruberi]|eukprot:XP_002669409.1 predicted protein [Naegleria gruberi strain NEG-M]